MLLENANMGYFYKKNLYYTKYDGFPLGIVRYDFNNNSFNEIKFDSKYEIYETCNPNVFYFKNKKYMLLTTFTVKKKYSLTLFEEKEKDYFVYVKEFCPFGNSAYVFNNTIFFGKLFRTQGREIVYSTKLNSDFSISKIDKLNFFYKNNKLNVLFSFSHYKDNMFIGSTFIANNIYVTFIFETNDMKNFYAKYRFIGNKIYKIKYSKELKKFAIPYKHSIYKSSLQILDENEVMIEKV